MKCYYHYVLICFSPLFNFCLCKGEEYLESRWNTMLWYIENRYHIVEKIKLEYLMTFHCGWLWGWRITANCDSSRKHFHMDFGDDFLHWKFEVFCSHLISLTLYYGGSQKSLNIIFNCVFYCKNKLILNKNFCYFSVIIWVLHNWNDNIIESNIQIKQQWLENAK